MDDDFTQVVNIDNLHYEWIVQGDLWVRILMGNVLNHPKKPDNPVQLRCPLGLDRMMLTFLAKSGRVYKIKSCNYDTLNKMQEDINRGCYLTFARSEMSC